jgi:formamidopyrimidine-DNA glycosylase
MPELPEVETTVRALAPHITGRTILEARFFTPRILGWKAEPDLTGRTIANVGRRGKYILLNLGGDVLSIHLGMTGKLLVNAPPEAHTRAYFTLDGATLNFVDPRMFGRIEFNPTRIARLGPEPLEVSFDEFHRRLKTRRTRVKALLLDQTFLSGVGNIYADESLHRAGIHPRAIAARLGEERARRLYKAIREVLAEAIASGGSSISDYVDAEGRKGWFQIQHRVYQRHGEKCRRCGTTIKRTLISQRGTHFCPKCQKR